MRNDQHVELLDDARQSEAVADRTRRRLLAAVEEQDATLRTSLRAASDGGAIVVVATTVGRVLRGRILEVGREHVALWDPPTTCYVRLDHVTTVRGGVGDPGLRAAAEDHADDRGRPGPAGIGAVLGALVEDTPTVEVHLVGGDRVRGDLLSAGADVLTLRTTPSGQRALVNLDVAVVIVLPTGSPTRPVSR